MEIGIGGRGTSLSMWKEYFPNAEVIGFEYDTNSVSQARETGHIVYEGDQALQQDLEHCNDKYGPFDIIIDDGGHEMGQQQISFGHLFPLLSPGGLYIIEDLHTSLIHTDDRAGSLTNKTTLDVLKELDIGHLESTFISEDNTTKILETVKYLEIDYTNSKLGYSGEWGNQCVIAFIIKHD